MEIRYGVIERKENVNALFLISEDEPNSDDTEEYEKLRDLRKKIIAVR